MSENALRNSPKKVSQVQSELWRQWLSQNLHWIVQKEEKKTQNQLCSTQKINHMFPKNPRLLFHYFFIFYLFLYFFSFSESIPEKWYFKLRTFPKRILDTFTLKLNQSSKTWFLLKYREFLNLSFSCKNRVGLNKNVCIMSIRQSKHDSLKTLS